MSGAAAFAAILGSVATPAASAAPAPTGQQESAGVAYSAPPGDPAARARIHCRLHIDDPHVSAETGTVEVAATVECSAPVSALRISVELYRNGELVGRSGPVSNNNSATIEGRATTGCSSNPGDRYFGRADGNVTYPPGFTPPDWAASTRSFTFTGLNC